MRVLRQTLLLLALGLCLATGMDAQTAARVTGVVSDANGEPLVGVTVVPVGATNAGALTDLDGNYTVRIPQGVSKLQFTYMGMKEQIIEIKGRTKIDVTLVEDTEQLTDVVVTALGIKRSQKALSYNVQEMKSDALTTVKDANFMNALAGKVAGVNINASASGVGGATRVVMRGPKSIGQSNAALYVIDGVPIFNVNGGSTSSFYEGAVQGEGISDINPDDIESMSVLSGPAAAALYGSNAAQGVIMITTKKGKEGKVSVMLSNSTSFASPFVMHKMQNEYLNLPGNVTSWGEKGTSPYGAFDPKKFFDTGFSLQNTASLTVGNDKNQTYVSLGTSNAGGIVPNSGYDKYNFTFRNTTKFLQDKLTLDANLNYIKQSDKNLMAQGQYMNPLLALYLFPRGEDFNGVRTYQVWDPVRKIYAQNWNYGDDYRMQNPYWSAYNNTRTSDKNRYMGNLSLKWQVLDWLDLTGRVRADMANTLYQDKRAATTLSIYLEGSEYGFYSYNKRDDVALYLDLMANVNKSFEKFSLSANLGVSSNYNSVHNTGFRGGLRAPSNIFTPVQIDYDAAGKNYPMYVNTEHKTNSAFFSGELGYRSVLYLTVTGRMDWDSALAYTSSNPFFYPSVGLSGVISEMVKLPSWFDYLKVRGSWAKVGSPIPAQLSSPYRYTFNPETQSYTTTTYRFPADFKPEATYSWEAGLSAKFLRNRISLDATVYQSITENQTMTNPLSNVPGFDREYVQQGRIRNRGIEVSLGLNNSFGQLDWNSTVTFSANQNRILDLGNNEYRQQVGLDGAYVYLKPGGTMGDVYITRQFARDPEGNVLHDAKGVIQIENTSTPIYQGTVLPDANLGWVNEFSYKGLSLGFMFSARLGGIVLSQTQAILDSYGVSQASADARNAGGIDFNKGKISAEAYYSKIGGQTPLWSEYIYDATNVRLQEAHISYTLPKQLLGNARLTLGLTARNLLMIYNKAPFDPELTASTGTYYQGFDYFMQPSLRNLGFNVKLQF